MICAYQFDLGALDGPAVDNGALVALVNFGAATVEPGTDRIYTLIGPYIRFINETSIGVKFV